MQQIESKKLCRPIHGYTMNIKTILTDIFEKSTNTSSQSKRILKEADQLKENREAAETNGTLRECGCCYGEHAQ